MDRPTLADILRTHGAAYRRTHALSPVQARAWRAIVARRTAALGGVRERCDACGACGAERHVWRSCRNRHCPQCQTRAKEAWRSARLRELLPVPYAHWVFTLPHALNPLAAHHPRWLFDTLFASAAATLLELAANPRWLGATPAFSLVLHTWTQDLRSHLHVHALITCGGLDEAGQWHTPNRGRTFLFPVQAASRVFRAKFLDALDVARRSGQLPDDPEASPAAWGKRHRAGRIADARAATAGDRSGRGLSRAGQRSRSESLHALFAGALAPYRGHRADPTVSGWAIMRRTPLRSRGTRDNLARLPGWCCVCGAYRHPKCPETGVTPRISRSEAGHSTPSSRQLSALRYANVNSPYPPSMNRA